MAAFGGEYPPCFGGCQWRKRRFSIWMIAFVRTFFPTLIDSRILPKRLRPPYSYAIASSARRSTWQSKSDLSSSKQATGIDSSLPRAPVWCADLEWASRIELVDGTGGQACLR